MKILFQPLHDHVLILRKEAEKKIGSIHVPDSVDNKPSFGTVIALGRGAIMNDGSVRPLSVKEGDAVVFETYAGFPVDLNLGEANKKAEFVVVKEEEILGVINER